MLIKPARPVHKIPVDTLAHLIPFGTLHNLLAPLRPAHLSLLGPALSPDPPVWYAWLELWYQMFCPVIFEVLEEDDAADSRALAEWGECHASQRLAGASEDDLMELEDERRRIAKGQVVRWCAIYVWPSSHPYPGHWWQFNSRCECLVQIGPKPGQTDTNWALYILPDVRTDESDAEYRRLVGLEPGERVEPQDGKGRGWVGDFGGGKAQVVEAERKGR
ncbi:hypothetical protein JCM8097_000255 [Rhodosporidiobolus ruineniae]